MQVSDIIIIAVFSSWLGLAVLVYIPALQPWVRGFDVLGMIPEWRFFAPNPGREDCYLLYRDKLEDGSVTDWTELAPTVRRQYWHAFWNPRKRGNKALFDVVRSLMRQIHNQAPGIEVSIPYLTLLNHVSLQPRSDSSAFTQFLLMRSAGDMEPELAFMSGLHAL